MKLRARKWGWRPDTPDFRDQRVTFAAQPRFSLPERVDLRAICPPVYDQGELGSCTAQAVGAALHFTARERVAGSARDRVATPSRLFLYYWTRWLEGSTARDSGASLRSTMKAVARFGYPPETHYPYVIDKFKIRPAGPVMTEAARRLLAASYYARVSQTEVELEAALAAKNPIAFGAMVWESIERVGRDGLVPMPRKSERPLGGHAMLLVGYDRTMRCFLVRNSWGARWGEAGYCWMPYQLVLDRGIAADFWTVSWVTDAAVSG